MALNRDALARISINLQATRDREREVADEQRDFDRRIDEAMVRSGQATRDPVSRKIVLVDQAEEFQKVTEQEARRLQLGARPGEPLSATAEPQFTRVLSPTKEQPFREKEQFIGLGGGLPSSPGGRQLVQSLMDTPVSVQAGQSPFAPQGGLLPATESPAATPGRSAAPAQPAPSPGGSPGGRDIPGGLGPTIDMFRLLQQLAQSAGRQGIGQSGLADRGGLTGQPGAAALPAPTRQPAQPTVQPTAQPAVGGPTIDPSDRSLIGPRGTTEGARIRMDDGSIWIIRNGEWVQES